MKIAQCCQVQSNWLRPKVNLSTCQWKTAPIDQLCRAGLERSLEVSLRAGRGHWRIGSAFILAIIVAAAYTAFVTARPGWRTLSGIGRTIAAVIGLAPDRNPTILSPAFDSFIAVLIQLGKVRP